MVWDWSYCTPSFKDCFSSAPHALATQDTVRTVLLYAVLVSIALAEVKKIRRTMTSCCHQLGQSRPRCFITHYVFEWGQSSVYCDAGKISSVKMISNSASAGLLTSSFSYLAAPGTTSSTMSIVGSPMILNGMADCSTYCMLVPGCTSVICQCDVGTACKYCTCTPFGW